MDRQELRLRLIEALLRQEPTLAHVTEFTAILTHLERFVLEADARTFSWDGIDNVYRYAARDADGSWYVFEREPSIEMVVWISPTGGPFDKIYYAVDPVGGDWRDSLQVRP